MERSGFGKNTIIVYTATQSIPLRFRVPLQQNGHRFEVSSTIGWEQKQHNLVFLSQTRRVQIWRESAGPFDSSVHGDANGSGSLALQALTAELARVTAHKKEELLALQALTALRARVTVHKNAELHVVKSLLQDLKDKIANQAHSIV
jgi:hypothetical protein